MTKVAVSQGGIKKFRKKPIVIEAIQYDGENDFEIGQFMGKPALMTYTTSPAMLAIPTLEGTMAASVNDWIIKGVNGEFYPCKPNIFEKTYEEVKD